MLYENSSLTIYDVISCDERTATVREMLTWGESNVSIYF